MIGLWVPIAQLALINPEIPRFVNFIVFVAVLIYFLRKPMAKFFGDRAKQIGHDLDQAHAERETARAQLQHIESRLSRLHEEIEELKARAATEAAAEEARIQAAAQNDAEKLRALAQREIQSSTNAARLELKAYAAAQAVEEAKEILRREMRDEDHHRLIRQFSEQIGEGRP